MIDKKWVREIHSGSTDSTDIYTFCGALELRYKHIAINWNAETRRKYERAYESTILPALENHNLKTVREYTRDDYENAIESIRERGYIKNGVRRRYSESTIRSFQILIYYVVYQASVYGLCDNVLWGSAFSLDLPDEEEEIEARVIQKRSLTVEQEKKLCKEIMDDIAQDGARLALLLMWSLGLRNAEACGLNYGDIKPLDGYKECEVAWIYKTTKVGSNLLQAGGKTYNTGRIIPIPDKVLTFIKKREALINKILLEQENSTIKTEELPICNAGELDFESDSYLRRCKAKDVTAEAPQVFDACGITSRQLAVLDAELIEGDAALIIKEKDPTAYLLRRNYATQAVILGLTNAEIQYLMGHEVEDAYEARNEYVDNERIFEMHKKLCHRALLNTIKDSPNLVRLSVPGITTGKIRAAAVEWTDGIRVLFTSGRDCKVQWFKEAAEYKCKRTVNMLNLYYKRYS